MSGCAACGTPAVRAPDLGSPPDVDECDTEVCPGENEKCENTEGSYHCICAEGYKQIEGICVKEQIPGEPHTGTPTPEEGWSSSKGRTGRPLPGSFRSCPTPHCHPDPMRLQ